MATFTACARFVRISPRKARQVAALIRGKGVSEAASLLDLCNRSAGRILGKVVRSAAANAMSQEGSGKLDLENLYVSRAWVDGGPMLKRFRAQSRGRAVRIRKRMSHLHVEVAIKE